jgi:hypothetical protein
MIQDINAARIANSLQMDKSFNGCYFIVEGPKDEIFFRKFIDDQSCQISIAHGKSNVFGSIAILNERGFKSALGIIDKDFMAILDEKVEMSNIVSSDFHDLEISIIESPAFDFVITTHCDEGKLKALEESNKKKLKEILYQLSESIGYLRLANKQFELGLSFKPEKVDGKSLTFSDFIDINSLKLISEEKLITTVFNYSLNRITKPKPKELIIQKYHEAKNLKVSDLRHLCNGHDITFIIQLALKRKIGNMNTNECSQRRLELDLIFAYDSSYFVTTTLYSEIKKWEANTTNKALKY